jgi:integrase
MRALTTISGARVPSAAIARRLEPCSAFGLAAGKVAEGWAAGMRPIDIAADLRLSKATVSYHPRRLRADEPAAYVGRRAVVATLGGSGVRLSELCDVRIGDLLLHAANGAHFRIRDAKTEASIREVQVSPDLAEEIVAHLDRLDRAGVATDPDAHLFPTFEGAA